VTCIESAYHPTRCASASSTLSSPRTFATTLVFLLRQIDATIEEMCAVAAEPGGETTRQPWRWMAYREPAIDFGSQTSWAMAILADMPEHVHKFVLLDLGFEPGRVFCTQLLRTGDFPLGVLQEFEKGSTKEAVAENVANRVLDGTIDPDELMLKFCRHHRQWLSVRLVAKPQEQVQLGYAKKFLTEFGKDGWYGPFFDDSNEEDVKEERRWYVHVMSVGHTILGEDDKAQRLRIRWHVVAEVTSKYVAFHWNNFAHNEKSDTRTPVQFAYWSHIPSLYESLAAKVNASWTQPRLQSIVLERIFANLNDDESVEWKDLRIRGVREGVAINAQSGDMPDDESVSGIRTLADALARSALKALKMPAEEETVTNVSKALLNTLILSWGGKSYEFRIKRANGQNLFRAHIYYGAGVAGTGLSGPDSLPHMRCFGEYGGSVGALEFILRYMV
jgi:hypothetical protein